MTDAQIDDLIVRHGPAAAMGLHGMFQDYIAHEVKAEREDADLANVMLCLDMHRSDAWLYAQEARACVGSRAACEAALTGRPFMLPYRGSRP